jgi:lipoprotein-releasing system permease protein
MRGTIIRSQNDATGLVIKGIDNFSDKQSLLDAIVEGSAPRIEEQRHKEILLPELVAKKLDVKSGERVELLSLSDGKPPKRDVFKICGLYRTMGELPVPIALTDIRNVQKINGWQSGTLSGFEIRTSEGVDNYLLSEQINNSLFEDYTGDANLSSVSAEQLYSNIFTWLETHDINATVIITIMFIVALFNMITALLIMLFERTRMVGILKSLGMSNSSIRKIFLYQAARIITIGLIVGNAIAIVLILVQKYTGVIKLDSSAYFVSQVPVSIGVVEILIINTIFATAILALLFAVTAIVSQIKPSEAVKYE